MQDEFRKKLHRYFRSSGFKYGMPLLVLTVGGSFVLQHFAQFRYDYDINKNVFLKLPKDSGFDLDSAYKEYQKSVDIDNWKNIRGPRPWETDNEEYKDIIEKRIAASANKGPRWRFDK